MTKRFCAFCGADDDERGRRTCSCTPPSSRLAEVAIAAARASSRDDSPDSFRRAFRAAAWTFRPSRKDLPS